MCRPKQTEAGTLEPAPASAPARAAESGDLECGIGNNFKHYWLFGDSLERRSDYRRKKPPYRRPRVMRLIVMILLLHTGGLVYAGGYVDIAAAGIPLTQSAALKLEEYRNALRAHQINKSEFASLENGLRYTDAFSGLGPSLMGRFVEAASRFEHGKINAGQLRDIILQLRATAEAQRTADSK